MCDTVGSGGVARWGVECGRDMTGSGVRALTSSEVGFRRSVILYTLRDDFEPLDPCELTTMMNRAQ
jgi:hypothetical protein